MLIFCEFVWFYVVEILIVLEEFYKVGLVYKDFLLEIVYFDLEGYVVIWWSFCGKFYWSKWECVCLFDLFCYGDFCDNNYNFKSEFDFYEDWMFLGVFICVMFIGESCFWFLMEWYVWFFFYILWMLLCWKFLLKLFMVFIVLFYWFVVFDSL